MTATGAMTETVETLFCFNAFEPAPKGSMHSARPLELQPGLHLSQVMLILMRKALGIRTGPISKKAEPNQKVSGTANFLLRKSLTSEPFIHLILGQRNTCPVKRVWYSFELCRNILQFEA
ncbi:hypothetical protein SBA3_240004 [Candidatus Sulfopaludibacter sp. SbA3]|nr:hypothetical protein SBA3_240004 [Candidatus Sulfopaludibacter sp. SbA3]